jgi:hypothetical protein
MRGTQYAEAGHEPQPRGGQAEQFVKVRHIELLEELRGRLTRLEGELASVRDQLAAALAVE